MTRPEAGFSRMSLRSDLCSFGGVTIVIFLVFSMCVFEAPGQVPPSLAAQVTAHQEQEAGGAQAAQGDAQPAAAQTEDAAGPQPQAQAAKTEVGGSSQERTFRPRLPNFYAQVVTEEQRQKIYDIQRKYFPKIETLRKQLEALVAQRDAEIEAVLTEEQKAKVEQLRKAASERRGTRSSEQ